MSRSRSIKPGFYLNEELAQCSLMARFIFPGLWMLADRSGRLEDRPLRIKAAILPYDNGDMNAMLDELQSAGMIVRYQHGNARYIQVLSFTKHQSPHVKEAQSTIPAPGFDSNITHTEPDTSTVQAPDRHGASTELAPPDCLLLTPDCLETPRETIVSLVANDVGNKSDKVPDCPQQQIVELFGELLPELPQPRAWEGQRANNLKVRWRWVLTAKRKGGERYATDTQSGIEFFRRMFGYVRESDFLMGRGKAGWLGCDLGWLVKAENFEKVLAGNYANKEAAA